MTTQSLLLGTRVAMETGISIPDTVAFVIQNEEYKVYLNDLWWNVCTGVAFCLDTQTSVSFERFHWLLSWQAELCLLLFQLPEQLPEHTWIHIFEYRVIHVASVGKEVGVKVHKYSHNIFIHIRTGDWYTRAKTYSQTSLWEIYLVSWFLLKKTPIFANCCLEFYY